MTKLTEMIKVKDAVVGAGILTALSGFISQPAHALIFRLFGSPNTSSYDFSLDTENSAFPVSELRIFDSNNILGENTPIFEDSNLSLNTQINTIDRDQVANAFNNLNFSSNVELTPTAQLFEYTIPVDEEITYTDLFGDENIFTLESVGFIAPNEFELNGSIVTVDSTLPDLESLDFFASRNISLPFTINGMVQGGSNLDVDNINSVPEPGTTIGILSLLGLGLGNTVRSKSMMKAK